MSMPWDDPDLVAIEAQEIEDDLTAQGVIDTTYEDVADTFNLYQFMTIDDEELFGGHA